jgi:hypothetical protein
VEYQKGVTGANVERAVFSNDSALIWDLGFQISNFKSEI